MPALFIYLIKVNIALLIFCGGYYAVLRHLTFYNLNRIYLVTAILFSTLYPLANLTDFLNRHEQIAKPVQVIVINWQEPAKTIAKTFLGHDQWFWLQAAFWLGVIIFAMRLLTQLLSLYRLHKLSEPVQLHQYMIRVIKANINPFSFWRNIYINPDNHAANELDAILEHEQIHVNEWHTLDILLGEISAVFYWFNPGIWLMKHAVRENIEFITDQKILQKGVDSKAYQYSLLSVNFGAQGNNIVNHFNISTIKKRIMMMNAKRSSTINITRYLLLIPAVMVLLLIFSASKAELNKAVKNSTHMISSIRTEITKIKFIGIKPTSNREKANLLSAVSLFSIIPDDTVKPGQKSPVMVKLLVDTLKHTYTNASGRIVTDTFYYRMQLNAALEKKVSDDIRMPLSYKHAMGTDTNKKPIITITGNAHPDIYIDGVKTDLGLNTVDPNNIISVDVVKDKNTSPNGAIYVVTKGHDIKVYAGNKKDTVIHIKGKNGEDRMVFVKAGGPDRIMLTGPKSSDVVGGVTTGHATLAAVTVSGRAVKSLPLNDSTVHTFVSGQAINKVKINGRSYASASKKIVVNGDTLYANTFTTASKAANLDTLLNKMTGPTVSANGLITKTVTGYRTNPARIVNVRIAAPISFANKLIIIDGKEATEKQMKKLSADKIETISVLKDDTAVAIYGEKARNGIVIITTNK